MIFEPLYKESMSQKGDGLGLSIIYNLVTIFLEGNIKCESDEGEGVKFMITFKKNN